MTRFDNRDVAFDVPEGWNDRTILAFEGPKPAGARFATNVTLSRVEAQPVSSLAAFVVQQIANLSSTLPHFELISQRNVTFGGLPAIELFFHWRAEDYALSQRITVFERKGVLWSFAASALRDVFEEALPGFDRIASTLKFVGEVPPGPPSGSLPPASGSSDRGGLERPRGW